MRNENPRQESIRKASLTMNLLLSLVGRFGIFKSNKTYAFMAEQIPCKIYNINIEVLLVWAVYSFHFAFSEVLRLSCPHTYICDMSIVIV